eukprot:Pgem_evm1s7213
MRFRLTTNVPHSRTAYGEEKDFELIRWKTDMLGHDIQDNYQNSASSKTKGDKRNSMQPIHLSEQLSDT